MVPAWVGILFRVMSKDVLLAEVGFDRPDTANDAEKDGD
ncbi:hypothetical protein ABENE_09415 [Asticcacaulis benevestitus DSM 16100 = ATCC BAA-896]|uniref:Uncharacterized protein n=1 Tax=Asticcacaulis benevestitus DSM 16100 = ATCC BAA-896 TaxID=1121022 RepID=V4PU08_9CAUL|nr:hypothetical protein ABENE_09415 [Asticcacaulis benevestitus DSM 16100 = ATCC BAA-896]